MKNETSFSINKGVVDEKGSKSTEKVRDELEEKERQQIIKNGYKSDTIDPRRRIDSAKYHVNRQHNHCYQFIVTGGHTPYIVRACDGFYLCNCPDYQKSPKNCKHIIAVRSFLNDPILTDNSPGVSVQLARSASAEEKLSNVVSQLKEKYKGRDIYSKHVIESENPELKWNTFNTWSKKVTGMPAEEYLISLGIMKEILWFQIRLKDIEPEDLKGKTVCVLEESGNTIPPLCEILKGYGAVIASPDDQSIDFLCLERGIMKEPKDINEVAYSLFEKLEEGQLSFSVLGPNFIRRVYSKYELNHKKTPKEREALGLRVFSHYPYSQNQMELKADNKVKVVSKVNINELPTIDDAKIYWTLRQFHEWFQVQGGSIRPGTKPFKFSDQEIFATPDQVRKEMASFKDLCASISLPSVQQYIIDHAEKKKDGSLYKGRLQIVAPFKYTGECTCYYALTARNVSDNEIVVSFEVRYLRSIDDMDYKWDHKVDDCMEGIAPSLLCIVKNANGAAGYSFRDTPGYIFVESDSGSIPAGAFASEDSIQYVEIADWTTKIGSRAFAYCTNLREISIPENIQSMASDAFEGCSDYLVIHGAKIEAEAKA